MMLSRNQLLWTILWLSLTVILGIGVYLLKNKMIFLEKEIREAKQEIIRGKKNVQVLRAEWTLLTHPEKLKVLSLSYLQQMQETDPKQMRNMQVLQSAYTVQAALQSEKRVP